MLKKRYFRKEEISVETHVRKMKELTDQLAEPISEEDQVVTLLGSLPSTLVTAMKARDNVSLSYIQQSHIREKHGRDRKLNGTNEGQAVTGKHELRRHQPKKVCYSCREPRRDCPRNHGCTKFPKSKHRAKPAWMETRDGSHTDAEGAFGASSQSSGLDDWIVDSGASSIMTWSRELLVEYKEFNKPQKV